MNTKTLINNLENPELKRIVLSFLSEYENPKIKTFAFTEDKYLLIEKIRYFNDYKYLIVRESLNYIYRKEKVIKDELLIENRYNSLTIFIAVTE